MALNDSGRVFGYEWDLTYLIGFEVTFNNTTNHTLSWLYDAYLHTIHDGVNNYYGSVDWLLGSDILAPGESQIVDTLGYKYETGSEAIGVDGWPWSNWAPSIFLRAEPFTGTFWTVTDHTTGQTNSALPDGVNLHPGLYEVWVSGTMFVDWAPDLPTEEICTGDGALLEVLGDWQNGVLVYGDQFPNQFALLFRAPNYVPPVPGFGLCIGGPGGQRITESLMFGGIHHVLDQSTIVAGQSFCLQAVHRMPGGNVAFSNAVRVTPN